MNLKGSLEDTSTLTGKISFDVKIKQKLAAGASTKKIDPQFEAYMKTK